MAYRNPLSHLLAHTGTPEVSAEALRAIGQIGGVTVEEIDTLTPFLRHGDAEVRIAAWSAVWSGITSTKAAGSLNGQKLDEYRASLPGQFDSEPAEVQAAIIEEIGKMKGVAKLSIEHLVPRLKSPDAEVRAAALRVLGKAGEAALDQVPLILEQAKDGDSIVRAGSIAALGSIGPAAVKPNLKLVANALLDSSDLVSRQALIALPAAGDALANFPFRVRTAYAAASPHVRATLTKAVPIILRGRPMNDEVIQLSRGPRRQRSGCPPRHGVRARASRRQKRRSAAAPLVQAHPGFRGGRARGRRPRAARLHQRWQPTRKQFRDALRPLLKDQDAQVRWAALDTLHELDPGQDPALVTEIAGLLKDEDEPVRDAAARTLGATGAAARPYLADIVRSPSTTRQSHPTRRRKLFFRDEPAHPPGTRHRAVSALRPCRARASHRTAYGASGGQPDGSPILHLLNRGQGAVSDLVAKNEKLLRRQRRQDEIKAPLLQDKLKAEITARLTEVQAIP